jgi:hypothetical protein
MTTPIRSTNAPEPPDEEVTQEDQIILYERDRETDWRRLIADLKERNFLDANAAISQLLIECRRAFDDENIAYELWKTSIGCEARVLLRGLCLK